MIFRHNLFSRDWCDLIFANRNREYGAYELRKNSNRRLIRSFILVVGVLTLLFTIPTIIISLQRHTNDLHVEVNLISSIRIQDAAVPDIPEGPIQEKDLSENRVKTQEVKKPLDLSGGIKIAEDGAATELGSVKRQEQASDSLTDANPFVEVPETMAEEAKMDNTPDEMAKFNGGEAYTAFRNYIIKNLKYPEEAMRLGVQGTVYVQFVVEKDGTLSHIVILQGVMPLIDDEVLRLVKQSPAWDPALKKGKPVRVAYTFPITFQMD